MIDFNAMFGTEPREDAEAADHVEGFATGQKYAIWVLEEIGKQFSHKSETYRHAIVEGMLDAL